MTRRCRGAGIALEEIRFDVYGCYGGTMRTERHQVTTVMRTSEEMAYRDTRAEHVEHAFQLLYETLPARLNGWRQMAELHCRIEPHVRSLLHVANAPGCEVLLLSVSAELRTS